MNATEGWQFEKHSSQRVFHYIRDTMALCRKLAFYTGDLVPDANDPKGNEDCAKCFRILRAQKQARALASHSQTTEGK